MFSSRCEYACGVCVGSCEKYYGFPFKFLITPLVTWLTLPQPGPAKLRTEVMKW